MHPVGKWLLSIGGGRRKELDQGLDSQFLFLLETVSGLGKKKLFPADTPTVSNLGECHFNTGKEVETGH